MKDIIELLHKLGDLKTLKRTGWVLKKVPNPESVADHSFRTAIIAILLSKKAGLDENKCVKMALIHDFAECVSGDITPHDNISDEEKHLIEKKAMEELFKNTGDEIIEVWAEYEKGETPEAKFVYELDKIEMLMQAFEYEQKHKDPDLSEFWEYVEKRVEDPKIKEMLTILKNKKNK